MVFSKKETTTVASAKNALTTYKKRGRGNESPTLFLHFFNRF
nr:MAG TPA: hypothetical protein [Caudoviricetes sp.]